MMGYGAWSWIGPGELLVLLGCVALVVGLVLLGAWALGQAGRPSRPAAQPPASPDAIEVLRLRFARGELTADEYRAARLTIEAER